MGPRERSLNRNPLSAMTPQDRKSRSVERSDLTTPMRMASNRKSHLSSEKRAPLSVARLSGRGSNIGVKTVKDSRPLNDKQYQQLQIRKILDFLREHHYTNESLTSKNFPLSAKEFADIFNFLYSFTDPETLQAIPYSRGEEHIVRIMKELNYTGTITKSNFVTLGSLHSWPTVLGCLAFLCDIARRQTKFRENVLLVGFPSRDENGFNVDKESRDLLQIFTTINCYSRFNQNDDCFEDLFDKFRDELVRSEEVDPGKNSSLQKEVSHLYQKIEALQKKPNRAKEMSEKLETKRRDQEKLQAYIQSLLQKNEELEKRRQAGALSTEHEMDRLKSMEQDLFSYMQTCNREPVTEMDMERKIMMEAELRRKLEVQKEALANQDKEMWQKDIQFNRNFEEVEDICKQFNKVWRQESLTTGQEPLVLPTPVIREGSLQPDPSLPGIKVALVERSREYRSCLRNNEKEQTEKERALVASREAHQAHQEQLAALQARMSGLLQEAAQQRDLVEREEAALDRAVTMLRTQLMELKSSGGSRKQVEERLQQLELELEQLQEARLTAHQKNQDFLRKVKEIHKSYVEDCEADRQAAMRSIQTRIEARRVDVEKKTALLQEQQQKLAVLDQKKEELMAKTKTRKD